MGSVAKPDPDNFAGSDPHQSVRVCTLYSTVGDGRVNMYRILDFSTFLKIHKQAHLRAKVPKRANLSQILAKFASGS